MNGYTFTMAVGGEWRGHSGLAPCPICQPERRADQRALSIRSADGQLLIFCHKAGCNFAEIMRAAGIPKQSLQHIPRAPQKFGTSQVSYAAAQHSKARQLWADSSPIEGTCGEAYLRGRAITCTLPPSLRWANDTYHWPTRGLLSAMLANVSTGGVHRTFFDKSGKRIIRNSKMMQGPCAGGAVALSEAKGPLVVCEGIETGLSLLSDLLSFPVTVWAALSTSGIKALELPQAAGRLTIAADGDAPGKEAATVLAARATVLGWKVSLLPAPDGRDWNDVLRMKGGAV